MIKLKQQEIDLKAMETQAKLQKDMLVDSEKLDIERDKLEADTSINLMKAAADVSKEDSDEAMTLFKENMINSSVFNVSHLPFWIRVSIVFLSKKPFF